MKKIKELTQGRFTLSHHAYVDDFGFWTDAMKLTELKEDGSCIHYPFFGDIVVRDSEENAPTRYTDEQYEAMLKREVEKIATTARVREEYKRLYVSDEKGIRMVECEKCAVARQEFARELIDKLEKEYEDKDDHAPAVAAGVSIALDIIRTAAGLDSPDSSTATEQV